MSETPKLEHDNGGVIEPGLTAVTGAYFSEYIATRAQIEVAAEYIRNKYRWLQGLADE